MDLSLKDTILIVLFLATIVITALICAGKKAQTVVEGGNATYFGGGDEPFYGGASTSNLVLLKKDSKGKDYEVLIGQLAEHGKKLQLPGGFVEEGEDMEKTALRGASAMTGEDYLKEYYGKGAAKTSLYKKDKGSERANVVLLIDKEKKLGAYEQNNELDEGFSSSKSRTKWVPVTEIQSSKALTRDLDNENVAIPFYLKRAVKESVDNLCKK